MKRLFAPVIVLALFSGAAAGQEKTMDDYVKLLTPELRTRIERARLDFEHWPDPRAKAAAEQVLEAGEASIPFLAMDLREGSAKVKACAAHIAGRMGAKILFKDLVEASKNEQVRPYLRDFLRAMVKLDPQESIDPLLEWLWKEDTGVRHIAYTFLDPMVSPAMVSKLTAVLSSPHEGTRQYAVRLLSAIEHSSVYDPLVAHLADSSAEVAREASDGLARFSEAALLEKLLAAFGDARLRPAAFALRTMVLIEDRHGIQVLTGDHATKLLAWTQDGDLRFVRAMGTVGVVNLGLSIDEARITDFLDRWSVPILIDTVGGGVFFDEYRAVRDLCFAKLNQVTGAHIGFKPEEWKIWWVANRATFKAVRGLRNAKEADASRMEIRYEVAEPGQDLKAFYFSVGARWGLSDPEDGVDPIVLSREEMGEVLARLEEASFFELEKIFGVERERTRKVDLRVRVENLQRRIVIHGYDARLLEGVLALLDQLVANHRWQRYWDKRTYADWQKWYQTYEPFWSQVRDPLERNKRLKTMIITSYEFLVPKRREEASEELLELMRLDAELTDSGLSILRAYLLAETGLTRSAENLVRVLAESRQMAAIRIALQFLLEKGSAAEGQALINHVLERGGEGVCGHMLREENARLRSAACEVMWQFEDEEVDGLLIEATKDTSIAVRRAAAYGLGQRARPVAVPALEELVEKGEDLELRKAALVALGRIGTESCLQVLVGALADADLQPAAVRGLGLSGRPEAVSPLFAVLEKGGGDALQQKLMVDALIQIGGPDVVRRFARLAGVADRSDLRLAAFRALAALDPQGERELLVGGLEDPDPEVVLEVALQLARLGDSAGLPILIQALAGGERSLACETELQRLTFRGVSAENVTEKAAFYAEWWQENHAVSRRVWLLSALRDKGYPVETLVDYAAGNLEKRTGCAVLVAALYDDQWFLAAGASHALRELSGREDLPVIDQNTSAAERAEVHLKWKAWWKNFLEIGGR